MLLVARRGVAVHAAVFFGVAAYVLVLEVFVFLSQTHKSVSRSDPRKVIGRVAYLLLTLTQRLPLLRNKRHPLDQGDILKIPARLAIDVELQERAGRALHRPLVADVGELHGAFDGALEAAAEGGAGAVGEFDLLGGVGFDPFLVLGVRGFGSGVGEVVVVLVHSVSVGIRVLGWG